MKGYRQDKQHPCTYHKAKYKFKRTTKTQEDVKDNGCNFNFINCGQGDACLIENKGKYTLIDFGAKEGSVKSFLDTKIPNKKIDYAICTHFHGDHMTDFENIFTSYQVKNLFVVKDTNPNLAIKSEKEYEKFEKHCKADNVYMLEVGHCIEKHSHNFKLGEAEFEFLGPTKIYNNNNDLSIVLKMNYKNNTVLFTGDISKNAESQLISWCNLNGVELGTNVLKVAHHGSKSSSCEQFLKTVNPSKAVVSCAKTNKYMHPDKETVERLEKYCFDISYTYDSPSVDFLITPDGELINQGSFVESYDATKLFETTVENYKYTISNLSENIK